MNCLFQCMSLKIRAFTCAQCLAWLYFCCSSLSQLVLCTADVVTDWDGWPRVPLWRCPPQLAGPCCKSSTSEEKPPHRRCGCNRPAAREAAGPGSSCTRRRGLPRLQGWEGCCWQQGVPGARLPATPLANPLGPLEILQSCLGTVLGNQL